MSIARVLFNKQQYALPEGLHEGRNLRAFFGVSDKQDLFREDWAHEDDHLITDDDVQYEVADTDKFYSVSRKINQS